MILNEIQRALYLDPLDPFKVPLLKSHLLARLKFSLLLNRKWDLKWHFKKYKHITCRFVTKLLWKPYLRLNKMTIMTMIRTLPELFGVIKLFLIDICQHFFNKLPNLFPFYKEIWRERLFILFNRWNLYKLNLFGGIMLSKWYILQYMYYTLKKYSTGGICQTGLLL